MLRNKIIIESITLNKKVCKYLLKLLLIFKNINQQDDFIYLLTRGLSNFCVFLIYFNL